MAYYDDDVASTASTTSTMVVSTRMRLKDFEPFSFYQTSQVLPALWHSQVTIPFLFLLVSQKIVFLGLGSSI